MQTKKDASFGVIPYIEQDGELKFFLIHQHSRWKGDSYWAFPKGHREGNETAEETARRELEEETRIQLHHLDIKNSLISKYEFEHNNILVSKEVTFFLGEATSKGYILQEEEVKDAGWFAYEAAREKLTYENAKKILEEAFGLLR